MTTSGLEIAIIGMSGRFPGAKNLDAFWQNLKQGVESIVTYSDEALQKQGVDPALLSHANYIKAGAPLEAIEWFDAEFFGFSPREAEILDPQHRLFLESAWEAMEQAGYDSEQYSGAVAVYAGAAMNSYLLNLYTNQSIQNSISPYQIFLASDKDFLTTRVSYKLNLKGPSVDIQTACSTSLVAVHIACQSLLSGECDLALAGGVAVSQPVGYLYQEGGIYSPDGHCRAFDAEAQGTVSGSGLGIVVLKRLEDAIQDGDQIQAVIKGSAINNDGALKVSYTAPSVEAQTSVIQAAHLVAEVSPDSISYIEAHGTGTALGDPIELAALTQVFQRSSQKQTCAIGSLKPNIGHLDTAAGIASLIKTTLALQHQQLPPSLNFQQPHPQIDFANSPFFVNASLRDWSGELRRAGVSSFGIGGTNAHVILESAPPLPPSGASRPQQLLLLSAKTPTALESMSRNLAAHLQQHSDLPLADVAYSLQVGRRAFEYRRMVICDSQEQAIQALLNPTAASQTTSQAISQAPARSSVAFLFPGQGSQYVNMGRELYDSEPKFRAEVDRCCDLLKPDLNLDLRDILYPATVSSDSPASLTQTALAQPALFTVEYALAQLWITWGIQPVVMIGHSLGEYVAACLAGVFSLADALRLVALRGRLMQQQPTGAMLAVSLSEAVLQPWLSSEICLAAHNGPELCVLSGTEAAVSQLQQELSAKQIACRRLHVSHAFHSHIMEAVQQPLLEAFQDISLNPPQIPFVSNLTGKWITAAEATDPNYWAMQLRQPVRFAEGMTTLLQDANHILLEVGAGHTLSRFAKQSGTQPSTFTSLHHANETQSDLVGLLNTIGQLWLNGTALNWSAFYAHERRYRLPLPTYPFERQRYWVEPQSGGILTALNLTALNPSASWFYAPIWERDGLSLPNIQTVVEQLEANKNCWLLFGDSELSRQLAQQLEQAGQDVITVAVGSQFGQSGYRAFTLNPNQPSDYHELLQDLERRELWPNHILHLWHLESESTPDLGFYSLLFLTQALTQTLIQSSAAKLTIITQQAQDVTGEECISPSDAKSLGFSPVISQEYPDLSCQCIDIFTDISASGNLLRTVHQILSEVILESDTSVAYRGRYRWQQQFKSIHPNVQAEIQPGHYLIVGDFETGLGIIWAEQLAKNSQIKLTLVGSNIPALSCSNQPNQQSIQSEITDSSQMQQAIEQAERQFGNIRGVFYSTPLSNAQSMGLIADLSREQCDYSFRTKVAGLDVLAKILQDRAPDFCLIQSSLSSIVGGIGLGGYAAANRAVDAFVQRQMQQPNCKTRWLSVNWDAVDRDSLSDSLTFGGSLKQVALTPDQVWSVTCRLLCGSATEMPTTQIAISKTDLPARIQQAKARPTAPTETHSRPQISSHYVAPQTAIEQQVAQVWQELLGIDQVGIHDNFFELGGHSLLAIQAISRLRALFQVELEMRSFLFEAPTVVGIAAAIVSQQPAPDELAIMAEILNEVRALDSDLIQPLTKPSSDSGLS